MSSAHDEQDDDGINDGFRPRRVRPDGWLQRAIAAGSVRDPALGPLVKTGRRRPANATVVEAPVLTMRGDKP